MFTKVFLYLDETDIPHKMVTVWVIKKWQECGLRACEVAI